MMQTELEKMFEKVDLTLLNRWGWHGLFDPPMSTGASCCTVAAM